MKAAALKPNVVADVDTNELKGRRRLSRMLEQGMAHRVGEVYSIPPRSGQADRVSVGRERADQDVSFVVFKVQRRVEAT